MALRLTDHALGRMAQRGIRMSDLDLILELGSEVDDGYLVRDKDCRELETVLKQFLGRVRRLRGKRVVVTEGCVITTFHARRSEQKHLLRAGH
jgi:hypothetical protein